MVFLQMICLDRKRIEQLTIHIYVCVVLTSHMHKIYVHMLYSLAQLMSCRLKLSLCDGPLSGICLSVCRSNAAQIYRLGVHMWSVNI